MPIQFNLNRDQTLVLYQVSSRKYRGILLPDCELFSAKTDHGTITVQEVETSRYSIRYTILRFLKKIALSMKEQTEGIRLQAVMKSDMRYRADHGRLHLKQGQYNILTDATKAIDISMQKEKEYRYFFTTYSTDFMIELGLSTPALALQNKAHSLTPEMRGIIDDILKAPYDAELLRFFYENKVRELLFLMLTQKERSYPSELSEKDIASIHAVDDAILSNLSEHIPITDLVKRTGLNESKLKKGFRDLFGMGIFERLLHYRMERAKKLLLETNMREKEIAALTGYIHLTSFIHAFRKRYGLSPRVYRKQKK
jgi:AraC family transcriptional activator of pyochelin receptor